MTAAPLNTLEAIRTYVFAGHATFTVVSKRTGQRRTYRLLAKEGDPAAFFARLLVGPDNTGDYRYLAFAVRRGGFGVDPAQPGGRWAVHVNKGQWALDAVAGLEWLLNALATGSSRLLEQAEVWHTGRCGKCGRTLTVPESVASGIGPVCEGRAA